MADRPVELIIPGLFDSGPDHWQSRWLALRAQSVRVELGRWHAPSRDLWVAHLDRAIGRQRGPVVLVAHSLGCLAVAWWAQEASAARLSKVRGAMLVAPPDVDRPGVHPLLQPFAPAPLAALPFPSLLVASRNDGYADFARLAWLAAAWGSRLADVGPCGHINAESGLGDWPQGLDLLERLIDGAPGFAPQPGHRALPRLASSTKDRA